MTILKGIPETSIPFAMPAPTRTPCLPMAGSRTSDRHLQLVLPDDYRMIPQLSYAEASTSRGECATLSLCLRFPCVRPDPSRSPRSREHPHPARSRRGSGAAGDVVFGRQGQRRDAALGEEGVFSVDAP